MTWEIPQGLSAIYVSLDWDRALTLRIHKANAPLTRKRTHDLEESKVGAVLYAMGQVFDKPSLFQKMVENGVIVAAPPPTPEQEFYDLLSAHDWTHSMSDDPSTYRRGREEESGIAAVLAKHPEWRPLYAAYEAYAWKKSPVKPERPL